MYPNIWRLILHVLYEWLFFCLLTLNTLQRGGNVYNFTAYVSQWLSTRLALSDVSKNMTINLACITWVNAFFLCGLLSWTAEPYDELRGKFSELSILVLASVEKSSVCILRGFSQFTKFIMSCLLLSWKVVQQNPSKNPNLPFLTERIH